MKISPPSRSLSKTTLLITPLFLCIMALLSTVSDVSYLFILQFSENVASDADLNLIGSVRRSNDSQAFDNQRLLGSLRKSHRTNQNATIVDDGLLQANIPIVSIQQVNQWVKNHSIVRGVSPRWLIPITLGSINLDSMMLAMNIQNERKVGLAQRAGIKNLSIGEAALSYEVFESLDVSIGDTINLSFQLKNIFSAGKMLEKFTDDESSGEDVPQASALSPEIIRPILQNIIKNQNLTYNITDEDIQRFIDTLNTPVNYTVEVAQKIKPQGAWASVLHNVIVVDIATVETIAEKLLQRMIKEALNNITDLPIWLQPYKTFGLNPPVASYIRQSMQNYAPIVAVSLNQRSKYYRPHEQQLNKQVVVLLEETPSNIEVLSLSPLYSMSLAIKYFFDSILQIFSFIAVLLYVNVMRIILKQVYDEKQIEIGVWRTLGIGGVKTQKLQPQPLQQMRSINQPINPPNRAVQLSTTLSLRQDLLYKWQMLKNVGHFPYWLSITFVSTILFIVFKAILINIVCTRLHYQPISQNIGEAILLFMCVLLFSQLTCVSHILKIYGNSIVESMKPFKRTFDIVKIRIIKMATFGIQFEVLLVSLMLIYYGLVSYYFIPRAVLYNNAELQTLLFNSIFFFMILGSIMLCTVLQSYLEMGILTLLSMGFGQIKTMRSVMLKNLKAKRFTNLKISLSIALIFAFVLFFTSGINMEIKLIQSFINRGLGSDLVLQNYDQGFNVTKISAYLNQHNDKVQYAWLSSSLNQKQLTFRFVDNRRSDKTLRCDFRVMTPGYLSASYYEYYVPESYLTNYNYSKLPNGILDGFDTIYNGNESVGRYNPSETFTHIDPYNISSMGSMSSVRYDGSLPKQEQVINLAISSQMRKKLGANPGYMYKLQFQNTTSMKKYEIRARITHVLKTLEGFDILWEQGFLSEQQARYLYSAINSTVDIRYVKLLVKGRNNQLQVKDVSSALLALSPEHTELNQVSFVQASFAILEVYLQWFISILSFVMNTLSVLLLFLYTRNKCRQQMEMYRILRAVGTPVIRLRIMVFCEVFVRVFISVVIGILMGIIFSVAFAHQVESLLMVQMPSIELSLVMIMASVLLVIFSLTVVYSTKDLEKMTVAQMARA